MRDALYSTLKDCLSDADQNCLRMAIYDCKINQKFESTTTLGKVREIVLSICDTNTQTHLSDQSGTNDNILDFLAMTSERFLTSAKDHRVIYKHELANLATKTSDPELLSTLRKYRHIVSRIRTFEKYSVKSEANELLDLLQGVQWKTIKVTEMSDTAISENPDKIHSVVKSYLESAKIFDKRTKSDKRSRSSSYSAKSTNTSSKPSLKKAKVNATNDQRNRRATQNNATAVNNIQKRICKHCKDHRAKRKQDLYVMHSDAKCHMNPKNIRPLGTCEKCLGRHDTSLCFTKEVSLPFWRKRNQKSMDDARTHHVVAGAIDEDSSDEDA